MLVRFSLVAPLLLSLALSASALSIQSRADNSSTCSQCSPFNDAKNQCHDTASCIGITGNVNTTGNFYCTCRGGFRADDRDPSDSKAQWRLPWKGQEYRVFVPPGQECSTLCDDQNDVTNSCKEVSLQEKCF
ncbi:MAG: hypothetical protein M1825_002201 [Sarcosagium campestre]|nr:MAG: hypothetical protein M1825_002201 [Sarcosagium campestre]